MVLIVRVEVNAAPARVTEAGESEQDGISVAPVGVAVTAHVNATAPAYGVVAFGVTEIIDVPDAPCDATVTLAGLLLRANVPPEETAASTTTVIAVVAVAVPVPAPDTVTV